MIEDNLENRLKLAMNRLDSWSWTFKNDWKSSLEFVLTMAKTGLFLYSDIEFAFFARKFI